MLNPYILKIAPCAIAALGKPGALLLAAFSTLVISGRVPAVTVALKLIDVRPATLTMMVAVPGLFPSVTCVEACPLESVCADEGFTDALVPVNVTETPETGFLFASATPTTSGAVKAVPMTPVWLLPETTVTEVGALTVMAVPVIRSWYGPMLLE